MRPRAPVVAKGGASRLAGAEVPKYEDNESTFDELVAKNGRFAVLARAQFMATAALSTDIPTPP